MKIILIILISVLSFLFGLSQSGNSSSSLLTKLKNISFGQFFKSGGETSGVNDDSITQSGQLLCQKFAQDRNWIMPPGVGGTPSEVYFAAYRDFYNMFTDEKRMQIMETEDEFMEALSKKDCALVAEESDKKLCSVYVSGDYSKVDEIPGLTDEYKNDVKTNFNAINTKKPVAGKYFSFLDAVIRYDEYAKSVRFDFTIDTQKQKGFEMAYFTFYRKQGKEMFFKELNSQFITSCQTK